MKPVSQLSKGASQIILWIANIVALLPLLAGRSLGQREPAKPTAVNEQTSLVRLTMPGWTEKAPGEGMRYWHDPDGDVLALAVFPKEQAYLSTSLDFLFCLLSVLRAAPETPLDSLPTS